MFKYFLLISSILFSFLSHSQVLPFETDGCTMFKEGTKNNPQLWAKCCYTHDLYYWMGGDKRWQKKVDLAFKSCIEKVHQNFMANIMYLAVRIGHLSPIKTSTHWSWGRQVDKKRRFSILGPKEKNQFAKEILNIPAGLISAEDKKQALQFLKIKL